MRARNIKPGFFKNEELLECTFAERLLYIGLWCLADRDGRMEYRPKRIKIELFPADDVDIESMVLALCSHGFVRVYAVDGHEYLDIPTFTKNQNPHVKEASLGIPPYENRENCAVLPRPSASTVQAPCKHDASPADSLLLNPESGLLNPDKNTFGDTSPRERENRKPAAPFDDFWNIYPNKKGRASALKWWNRNRPDSETFQRMIQAIHDQAREKESRRNRGMFCPEWPHGSTWLNGRRWEDTTATDEEISAEHRNGHQPNTHTTGNGTASKRNYVPTADSILETAERVSGRLGIR